MVSDTVIVWSPFHIPLISSESVKGREISFIQSGEKGDLGWLFTAKRKEK